MESVMQCQICGVEYAADRLPALCPICVDERQYLAADRVQRWASPEDYDGTVSVVETEPRLFSITVDGGPGIGQQAQIVVTEAGNVMVEAPSSITADAVAAVRALGPMRTIIASHPHMYGVQSLWARQLDAEVLVSTADRQWLGIEPKRVRYWDGSIELAPDVVASQPGGHFPGSAVVHWAGGDGRGVLLAGDTVSVNPDFETVAFMRSYPNRIPLSANIVQRIAAHLERYTFDRLYDNFGRSIRRDAMTAVRTSAARHAAWANGEFDHLTGPG